MIMMGVHLGRGDEVDWVLGGAQKVMWWKEYGKFEGNEWNSGMRGRKTLVTTLDCRVRFAEIFG